MRGRLPVTNQALVLLLAVWQSVPGEMNLFTFRKTLFQLGQLLGRSRRISQSVLGVPEDSEPWGHQAHRAGVQAESSVIPTGPCQRLPSGAQISGRGEMQVCDSVLLHALVPCLDEVFKRRGWGGYEGANQPN